ncbi:hypothetical protein SV7mr_42190 [Stieleria bergensis]|uniref:Arrestin-like N-terminal domain-containing protein n=1 Tax=Stieleria bergensis TaxID=2528025 RepID=A0A517SZV2_9BACT|nr:hypothetical protein SV7mr_42190 [Planctomycetes bacterium SV_7m_r]
MAKCDLSIELEDPNRVYRDGDTIRGKVHVMSTANVNCKKLEVSSGWQTHGRGNKASGTTESLTLYQGEWQPDQTHSYPFELRVSSWPPSYHGHYINIDHYVSARAYVPWSFDPKAESEFIVRPTSPDAPLLSKQNKSTFEAGCFVGGIILAILGAFVAVFVFFMMSEPLVGLIIGLITLPLATFAVIKWILPRWLLGKVEVDLKQERISPGETIVASLALQPKRQVPVNCIVAELIGEEVCVSGSGSNRTTHRHKFFNRLEELQPTSVLRAGERKEFDLQFPVPDDVPYSFDLSDNDLRWTLELRVDIPRWPDWKHILKLQIVPGGNEPDPTPARSWDDDDQDNAEPIMPQASDRGESSGAELSFSEAAEHLRDAKSASDEDQIDLLVQALQGIDFDIQAVIERRLLYSGPDDPKVYPDGYAVWATSQAPRLGLVLFVPHQSGDDFEHTGRDPLSFRGRVIGWDHQHDRLQIQVLEK